MPRVGGFLEGGQSEHEHQHEAAGAEGGGFRTQLDKAALPAGDMEAVHEAGEALIGIAQKLAGLEQEAVDARIDVEQPGVARLPVVVLGKLVGQGRLFGRLFGWPGSGAIKAAVLGPRHALF